MNNLLLSSNPSEEVSASPSAAEITPPRFASTLFTSAAFEEALVGNHTSHWAPYDQVTQEYKASLSRAKPLSFGAVWLRGFMQRCWLTA